MYQFLFKLQVDLRSEEKISKVLDFASRAVIGTIAMQLKESEQDEYSK